MIPDSGSRVSPPSGNRGEKILIAQTGFLGDVVLTTPLISEVKRRFSPCLLALLVTPQAQPLLEHHPGVDDLLSDEKTGEHRGPRGVLHLAHRLRQENFSLAFAPHKSFRTALLLAVAGIPRRVGFRASAGWFLYHQAVARDLWRHEVERILCLLRAFGIEPEACEKQLRVSYAPAASDTVDLLFRTAGVDGCQPLIGISPGSAWPTKRWTVEGYAALVRRLEAHYGRVVIFGSPDDVPLARAIHERAGKKGVDLTGKTTLATLVAAIDRLTLLIANDSAPMHIASALGIPVVAIFCATSPGQGYTPYHAPFAIVEKDLACRPCGRHGGRYCPRDTEDCMRLITVEDVLAGMEKIFSARRSGGMAEVGADR